MSARPALRAPRAEPRAEPASPEALAASLSGLGDVPGHIILAVSGGPDSTALMHAAARWAAACGRAAPAVATLDHGLRAGSRAEAEAVGAAAAALGLPHRVLGWARPSGAPVSQAAARDARYRLLAGHAGALGAGAIVTAHTLDDQAETLLIRMAAGSGLSGLAGMRPVSRTEGVVHLRPFLGLSKADLIATCRAEGWRYHDDPSNADPRFARVRWRALMPELAAEGLDAGRLGRLAARLARANAALDAAARAALARCRRDCEPDRIDLASLAPEPSEIRIRALAFLIEERAREDAPVRLGRVEACADGLFAALAGGISTRRTLAGLLLSLDRRGRLAITPETPRSRGRARPVTLPVAGAPHSLGIAEGRA